jgi:inward rectifier potassium channel
MSRRQGDFPVVRTVGLPGHPFQDLYHSILKSSWLVYFTGFGVCFLAVNAFFALFYWLAPGAIANATPGSFGDAFFFSVQTLATIGYGSMAPATLYGHLVVTAEALVGMVGLAIVTGLTFAKFSRPTSRVIFSEKAVLGRRDDAPYLMFRMGNARSSTILEAQLRVILLAEETSAEGQTMRVMRELPLVRDRTAVFALTWTAMHPIDEKSPFFGDGAIQALRAKKAELFLTLSGLDETFSQTVHARYRYELDDLAENALFRDVVSVGADGARLLDYAHFHEVVPLGDPG